MDYLGLLLINTIVMAIRNNDGSTFAPSGTFQKFDPENPELDLFNVWDQESIEIGGAPILYYEVFISMNTIDKLYVEDRGKIWSQCPICLHALYDPIPSQNFLGAFGVDSPDEMVFDVNFRDVLRRVGHPPKIGSRIYTPHRRENWVIIQRNGGEFKLWGELRMQILCERFQESVVTGEGKVTQREPDFKVNDIKDLNNPQFSGGQPTDSC